MSKKETGSTATAEPDKKTDGVADGVAGEPPVPSKPTARAAEPQLPTMGRIIFVTTDDGDTVPGIVAGVESNPDTINLNCTVFHPVMGAGNAHISDARAKFRATPGERGTWSWPPRA